MKKLEFTVTATPSLNKVLHNDYQYWKWKAEYRAQLRGYELLGPKQPVKARLTIKRTYTTVAMDLDNFHGGCKMLIDIIKDKGLIHDDSPDWVEIVYLPQEKAGRGQGKTEITIEWGI